jgi:peptide/nickel transport system substrate-binding protein
MALTLVDRMFDPEMAQAVQLGIETTGASDNPGGDPAILATLHGKTIDIGWDNGNPVNGRIADLIGSALQPVGLRYQSRAIPDAETFALPSHPAQAPDILVTTLNPDAGHPDTWVRIFMNTTAPVNYFGCSVPAADKLMDQGLHTADSTPVAADYAEAGAALVLSGCWDTIADVHDVVVARKGIGGLKHQLPANSSIVFAALTAT